MFQKGVSGNPLGRRGKPKDDIAVLEAIERRLRQPVGAPRGRSYADKLAAQVIDGATRHGTSLNAQKNAVRDLKELLAAEAILREHRLKGETQAQLLPWDDLPETPGERDTALPVRETEEDARQRWVQALTLAPVEVVEAPEQGFDGLGSPKPLSDAVLDPAHQAPVQEPENDQQTELDAWERLAVIQAKASPLPRFAVFGQPPKPAPIPVDDRFDPLKGLDGQTIWAITHEPWFMERPLPEQEPPRRPSSLPYRIGIPGEQR